MPTTCVVLPIYNELRIIPRILERLRDYARQHPQIQFCLVDDGSTDGTSDYLRTHVRSGVEEPITLVQYAPNRGKGHAIALGFAGKTADLLIFTDGDLAYSLDHIALLCQQLADHEVVIGSRELQRYEPRNSSLRRQVLGRSFNELARLLTGLPYRDTQAGLKGFQRAAAHQIFSHKKIEGFGFDVELLFLAHKYKFRVQEIHAEVDADHSYKISKLKLLRDSVNMFVDLLRIRYHDLRGAYER